MIVHVGPYPLDAEWIAADDEMPDQILDQRSGRPAAASVGHRGLPQTEHALVAPEAQDDGKPTIDFGEIDLRAGDFHGLSTGLMRPITAAIASSSFGRAASSPTVIGLMGGRRR